MSMNEKTVKEIDLVDIIRNFWRLKVVVILLIIVFAGGAYGVSKMRFTEDYHSDTTLYVTLNEDGNSSNAQVLSKPDPRNYMDDFAHIATSRNVSEKTIKDLDLDMSASDLSGKIKAEAIPNTRFIQITVTDGDPKVAKKIAASVADNSVEQIGEMTDHQFVAKVEDQANLDQSAPALNSKKAVAKGGVVGLFLSIVIVFISSFVRVNRKVND